MFLPCPSSTVTLNTTRSTFTLRENEGSSLLAFGGVDSCESRMTGPSFITRMLRVKRNSFRIVFGLARKMAGILTIESGGSNSQFHFKLVFQGRRIHVCIEMGRTAELIVTVRKLI